MTALFLINDREQYMRALQMTANENLNSKFFCADENLAESLRSEDKECSCLNQDFLPLDPHSINQKSIEYALQFIRLSRGLIQEGEINIPEAVFHYFSAFLSGVISSYEYASVLLDRFHPEKIHMCKIEPCVNYPFIPRIDVVKHLVFALSEKRHQRVDIDLFENCSRGLKDPVSERPRDFRRGIKCLVEHGNRIFNRVPNQADYLFFGSLKHLSNAMTELMKMGKRVIVFDYQFNFKQYSFCIKYRIPYLTPENFSVNDSERFNGYADIQMERCLQAAQRKGLFVYQGYDFSDAIRKVYLPALKEHFKTVTRWIAGYEQLVCLVKIQKVIVEEDFDHRGFFGAFMKMKGIPMFTISHAHTYFGFQVAKQLCEFSQSITLVNSEDEKDKMYIARGWNPDHIHVTGLPRYDNVVQLRRKEKSSKSSTFRILFCASCLEYSDSTTNNFFHLEENLYKKGQILAFEAVTRALAAYDHELWVKPHYLPYEKAWRDLVMGYPRRSRCKVFRAADPFIQMLRDCDVMVTMFWTTGLIEAGLLGVPCIYYDVLQEKTMSVQDYMDTGLCFYAENENGLKEAIRKAYGSRTGLKVDYADLRIQHYLGTDHGRATQRAVEFIENFSKTAVIHNQRECQHE